MKQKLTLSGEVESLMVVANLPDPVVGIAYSEQVQISGGIPPYIITPVQIPNGLTLTPDGLFSGTATITGPWSFTVEDSGK